jgi:Xaa-Pro aminopeptidase
MTAAEERIATRVSDAELERRWAAVRNEMADRKIDALIMQSSNDWLGGYARWFTGLPAHNGYPRTILFYADRPMTVIEMGPTGAVRKFDGRDPTHRGVGEMVLSPSFFSAAYSTGYDAKLATAALKQNGCRTLGVLAPGALPHGLMAALKNAFKGQAKIVDATDAIDRIKAVKSAEEIALLERTAIMQDEVFAKVVAAAKPGMRDIELTALAQYEGQIRGSEQGIFLGGSSPLSERSPFLPRSMQGRKLRKGDHLSLLIENNGAGGLYTEIARTIVLGKASNELKDGFESVREAQAHTLSMIRPGASCREIYEAHNAFMRARGLPPELRLYAHGQGYDMVERPLIRDDETMTLAAGMCLAVHPGYETPSLFAVICDNYMVEAAGVGECLHKTEKKVFEIE